MNSIAKSLPLILMGTFALAGCGGPVESDDGFEDEAREGALEIGSGASANLVPYCDDVVNWDPTWTQYEDQVLTLVNQRRAQGAYCAPGEYHPPASPLTFDARLRCAARKHSKDMAARNTVTHTGYDNSTFSQRIASAGYPAIMSAENVAGGTPLPTPTTVVDGWMNSKLHCENIMRAGMKNLGTGYYKSGSGYVHFWTQNFGTHNQPTPTPRFDFDGDGKADASVFRPSDGTWYILGSAGSYYGTPFGQSGDIPVAADYDGDKKSDVAVFRAGTWYRQRSTAGVDILSWGVSSDVPAPADYDGDGKADLAVFRPSDGTWYRTLSSNGQISIVQFGVSGDIPVAGDFDGDHKADISVFRPSNGTWYRLNSSDGAFAAVQFGSNGDRPVSGDFDGDGKADPAVFRPSNGGWYILASSSGAMQGTTFGQSGDTPVTTDYDGDGKDDIAVFRPSNGTWYRLDSSNNAFVAFQFGVSTDIPAPALP
jgi:uncharacterized protein YkwD